MVNKRLKILRKKIGLTQTELGKRLGKKLRTVQDWEAGENIPESAIKLMAIEFNVNSNWLKTGEGEIFAENIEQAELNEDLKELFQLLREYGNPKIISEFKSILLKIKKATDEVD